MDRFQWLIDEIIRQFNTIEEMFTLAMAKMPYIGDFVSSYGSLIVLGLAAFLTIFIIKPLIKWSLGVIILGTFLAAVISYFSGMNFWGVLPLTALGASIVMFSNKFTMG